VLDTGDYTKSAIAAMEDRIEALYEEADPKGIVVSAPGIARGPDQGR